ncbi:MAG: hypothetical protein E5Y01_30755 [Mesorhizobium sp.]|nr:MAG: hypothetical protein E5Y01_30755 [Mesorhizobium sp.]
MAKKKSRPPLSAIATASPSEASEAVYFARKCGLTPDEALWMMRQAQRRQGARLGETGTAERRARRNAP